MLTTNTKRTVQEMALEGDQSAIADLLDTKPELVKRKDESGRIPLHWAVSRGHTDLAAWLLDKNRDVEAEDEAGWTPLIIASSAGHETIVR